MTRDRSRRPRSERADLAFPIGGRRAVAEAIRAGRVSKLLVVRASQQTEGLRALLDEAASLAIPVEWTDRPAIDRLAVEDAQGVVAFVRPLEEIGDHEFASMTFDPDAVVVILDGITDPQNLGACARSAEAAGAALLVVRRRRSAPSTAAAVRASAGALLHLRVARVTNLTRAIEHLKQRGFFVVGLHEQAAPTIYGEPPPRPLGLVVGAEGTGISRLVRESCDLLASIPLQGLVGSLNASAALAVGLFGFALRPTR